jgi:hypothetical protein
MAIALLLIVALGYAVSGPVAAAQSALSGGDWAPAAGAAGDNTYEGFIDQPLSGASISAGASFQVSGWIVDSSAEGWSGIDDVQVLLGTTLLAHAAVGASRPDVASATGNPYFGNAGFQGVVSGGVPAGQQTLTIVAHTPGKGSWSKDVAVNVTGGGTLTGSSTGSGLVLSIISPSPDDEVVSNNSATIFGVAHDTRTRTDLGVGVDRVQVCLDGPCGEAGSQTLGDATFSGDNWSLQWEPTRFNHVRHHVLFVYAHSAVTGEQALVTEEINLSR